MTEKTNVQISKSKEPPLRYETSLVTEVFHKEDEAARQLGTTIKTLQSWRCRGIGPRTVKIGNGRAVRYPQSFLDEYKFKVMAEATKQAA